MGFHCEDCGCWCTKRMFEEAPIRGMKNPEVTDPSWRELKCTNPSCRCHDLSRGAWEVLGLEPPVKA